MEDMGPGDQSSFLWIRDKHNRIGKLYAQSGIVHYASGEQKAPNSYDVIPCQDYASAEYDAQCEAMWEAVSSLEAINRRVLKRLIGSARRLGVTGLNYDELLSDVGLKTLCKAVLLYDPNRGVSLKFYAAQVLQRAYTRVMYRKREFREQITDHIEQSQGKENLEVLGLITSDQLSIIVERASLSSDELELLVSRYEDQKSLREIARELGQAPQTVLNNLNRILARCRDITEQTDTFPPH